VEGAVVAYAVGDAEVPGHHDATRSRRQARRRARAKGRPGVVRAGVDDRHSHSRAILAPRQRRRLTDEPQAVDVAGLQLSHLVDDGDPRIFQHGRQRRRRQHRAHRDGQLLVFLFDDEVGTQRPLHVGLHGRKIHDPQRIQAIQVQRPRQLVPGVWRDQPDDQRARLVPLDLGHHPLNELRRRLDPGLGRHLRQHHRPIETARQQGAQGAQGAQRDAWSKS
jgi:hypothetical protein